MLPNSSSSFTPHITTLKSARVNESNMRNGSYVLALVHIKSLEPHLSRSEVSGLKVHVPDFTTGVCEKNNNCIYASSIDAQMLERGSSIKRFWNETNLSNKKWLSMPWNPTTVQSVLTAVDLKQRKMFYLDHKEKNFYGKQSFCGSC